MGGSGTTAEVAVKLRRRIIHIDVNPKSIICAYWRIKKHLLPGDRVTVLSWTREGERILSVALRGWATVPATPARFGERSDLMTARAVKDVPWDDGRNWLLLGDSLKWMKVIPDGIIQLIYCDPPFNTGRNFGDFNDAWDEKGKKPRQKKKPIKYPKHLPEDLLWRFKYCDSHTPA